MQTFKPFSRVLTIYFQSSEKSQPKKNTRNEKKNKLTMCVGENKRWQEKTREKVQETATKVALHHV